MLREEVEQYTKLTGEDGWHVPIVKIGAYLDGYNKGVEVLDKIRAEIEQVVNDEKLHDEKWALGLRYAVKIINKYKSESKQ